MNIRQLLKSLRQKNGQIVKVILIGFMLLIIGQSLFGNSYYVAPKTAVPPGDDTNPGTITAPWATWSYAFSKVRAGDTIYLRGGSYPMEITNGRGIRPDTTGHQGTPTEPVCIFNYPGETPVLDCSNVSPISGFNAGLVTNHLKYWHFKGLHIANVKEIPNVGGLCYGLYSNYNDHVSYENMVIHNIDGKAFLTEYSIHTEVINCDAYDCCDYYSNAPGGWATGFGNGSSPTDTCYTYYYGCRAWNCSDQGFSAGREVGTVVYDNCWSFNNGLYDLDGCEGFGFKLSWAYVYSPHDPNIIMKNCIATNNRAGGITTNDGGYSEEYMYIFNNLVYHNGYYKPEASKYGFFILNPESASTKRVFQNNISYNNYLDKNIYASEGRYYHTNNSWDTGITLTNEDFVSLDYSELELPRKQDGSLPDINFGKLVSNSDLVDAGTDVGLSYSGIAPDMGWCESSSTSTTSVPVYISSTIENATPSQLELTYNLALANITPSNSAFTVFVNSSFRTVNAVIISGTKVLLTLASPVSYGDNVTVAYTKPSYNPLQTPSGGLAASILAQNVINNTVPSNQPPVVNISSPTKSTSFVAPATIVINATASDSDGSITKVEFFSNSILLGKITSAPYSYTWKGVPDGMYSITVTATDNKGLISVSSAVTVVVEKSATYTNQLPSVNVKIQNNNKPKIHDDVIIVADASDPDGIINKVVLKNGNITITEMTMPPYIYTLQDIDTGTYVITATATDNMGGVSISDPVELKIEDSYSANPEYFNLYPNPNSGNFIIEISSDLPAPHERRLSIINLAGQYVFSDYINTEENSKNIGLPNLQPGTYILMISEGSSILGTRKFIKK